jgi:ADP-heptose:LPS heptosyltransferase
MRYRVIRFLKNLIDLLKYLRFFIMDSLAITNKKVSNSKNLLIVKMDAIGDYILFRNFLKAIKEDKKYSKYKITLCGNSVWKDISEKFDSKVIDEFYWINKKKFLISPNYRYKILKEINKRDFGVTINPTYSREFFSDVLIKASRSRKKIGGKGDHGNIIWWQKLISDKYYTQLLDNEDSQVFEFYKNERFFEKFLGRKLSINKTTLKMKNKTQNYAVLFTMANAKRRKWNLKNFLEIKEYLEKVKKLKVHIVDKKFKSINDLITLISNAKIVISNDTCASHISAACNVPLVCILHGRHFGRFAPYPNKIYNKGLFLYPKRIMGDLNKFEYLAKKYKNFSNRSINEIKVQQVKESIIKLLS